MIKRMKVFVLILIKVKGTEGKIHISILNIIEHLFFSDSLSQQPV